MNWAHVLLAGYIGMVIAIVVGVFRKKGWIGKTAGGVIFIIAIIAWNLFDVHYLIPRESPDFGQTEEQKFESAMSTFPTFQVIKEQDPVFWQHIRDQSAQMKREGKDQQQIIDAIQPQILQLQMARLQQAPDTNVVEYMKINLEQIAAAKKSSDDVCFRFLFPAVKGGVNPVKVMGHDLLAKRTESDARMMRASFSENKHTVTQQEKQQALADMQSIGPTLMARYGQDVQIMSDPSKGVGKEGIACDIVQDFWTQVLALPEANAAGAVRLALSPEMQ